jgi:hypothetical protein
MTAGQKLAARSICKIIQLEGRKIVKKINDVGKSLFGIVFLVLLLGVWVAPVAAAAPPDQEGRERTAGLKYALKWLELRLDAQQDRFDSAQAAVELVKEFIAEEKEAGHDTAELEAALADLEASLREAQGFHDDAAQILAEKAGYDSEGNVIDPQQARDTLKNAGRAMREANQIMREAHQDFREAFREYRQSKRDDRPGPTEP